MARDKKLDNLNVVNFDASGANRLFEYVDVDFQNLASFQLSWEGATSSDSFTSKGTITIEQSNDRENWFPLMDSAGTPAAVALAIGAARGGAFVANVKVSCKFLQAKWTKNNSTAGTATLYAMFKKGAY